MKEAVELSSKYNVLSKHTAFLAVERVAGTEGKMEFRKIPLPTSSNQGGPMVLYVSTLTGKKLTIEEVIPESSIEDIKCII